MGRPRNLQYLCTVLVLWAASESIRMPTTAVNTPYTSKYPLRSPCQLHRTQSYRPVLVATASHLHRSPPRLHSPVYSHLTARDPSEPRPMNAAVRLSVLRHVGPRGRNIFTSMALLEPTTRRGGDLGGTAKVPRTRLSVFRRSVSLSLCAATIDAGTDLPGAGESAGARRELRMGAHMLLDDLYMKKLSVILKRTRICRAQQWPASFAAAVMRSVSFTAATSLIQSTKTVLPSAVIASTRLQPLPSSPPRNRYSL